MIFRYCLSGLLLLAISACMPYVKVKKDELKKVKRVAVVSFQAKRAVPAVNTKGSVTGWRILDQRIIARQNVINFERLARAKFKWKILSYRRMARNKYYRRLFWRKGKLVHSVLPRKEHIYPTRLHPINLAHKDKQQILVTLGGLAKRLRVDALILVHNHYTFEGLKLSPLGTGPGRVISETWFQIVNKNGLIIAEVPKPGHAQHQGSYSKKVTVVKGDMPFRRSNRLSLRKAFILAGKKSASLAIDRLVEKM